MRPLTRRLRFEVSGQTSCPLLIYKLPVKRLRADGLCALHTIHLAIRQVVSEF